MQANIKKKALLKKIWRTILSQGFKSFIRTLKVKFIECNHPTCPIIDSYHLLTSPCSLCPLATLKLPKVKIAFLQLSLSGELGRDKQIKKVKIKLHIDLVSHSFGV